MVKLFNMTGLETILTGKKIIAIIFRKSIKIDGIKFFTDENNPFQIGIHDRKKGIRLKPHMHHLAKPLTIKTIQEILLVQRGSIKLSLFDDKGKLITQKILTEGDSVLLISGGHGVEFLKDSRIFEVKQGPYPGLKVAKLYFK